MKTSVLRYHKQTDSLRKVSLPLRKMETEHPPGTQVSLEPSVHVCLISQWEVHSIKASRNLQASFWDKVTPPLKNCSHILLRRTKIRGKHSLWALPETSPPFLQKLPGAKEAYYCNHLPEQEMQAPTLPQRLTEASPVHITWVSSNFNNVSNTHIFLEGW